MSKKRPVSAEPSPAAPHGITDTEWLQLQVQQAIQSVVQESVTAIIDNTMHTIEEKEVDRRIKPHVTDDIIQCMQTLIEVEYLHHDTGESNVEIDTSWQSSPMPLPCQVDSFAPASMPCLSLEKFDIPKIQKLPPTPERSRASSRGPKPPSTTSRKSRSWRAQRRTATP
eukprot:m.60308 g.60308  ORF g.60308 m.60308 type:complete len:169 (-) comp11807_c1_seq2:43-549(-)